MPALFRHPIKQIDLAYSFKMGYRNKFGMTFRVLVCLNKYG